MRGAPKGHKKYGGGIKKGQKHKKTIKQELALQITRETILKELGGILQALISKCKQGNIPAIQEALNRAIGKIKDTLEIEGELPVRVIKIKKYEKK